MKDILRALVKENNLEQKSIDIFWKNFEKYCVEEEEEFKSVFNEFMLERMYIKVQSISFKLGNWPECNYNHIVVNIPIIYDQHEVGDYTIYYNLEDEEEDDYFVIY